MDGMEMPPNLQESITTRLLAKKFKNQCRRLLEFLNLTSISDVAFMEHLKVCIMMRHSPSHNILFSPHNLI